MLSPADNNRPQSFSRLVWLRASCSISPTFSVNIVAKNEPKRACELLLRAVEKQLNMNEVAVGATRVFLKANQLAILENVSRHL